RRWVLLRRHYRDMVGASSIRRDSLKLAKRSDRWNKLSLRAAEGFSRLEWKRVQRVVGIRPWREQILLRLKLHAFSTYDSSRGQVGCPQRSCISQKSINLHHIFWTCPEMRRLRKFFLVDGLLWV
ncbi:reverse transcriptase, partial [Phytophthora megakarya]